MPVKREQPHEHDLLIVGGGPAGLSAATYSGSERLKTGVADSGKKLGGQARTSTLIENYAGFPHGITGPELMGRMAVQAERFGAKIFLNDPVETIERTDRGLEVTTRESGLHVAQNVLLANGVQYNRHPARYLEDFMGRGVQYGSPDIIERYKDQELFVVGGANSAGQAAVALADCEGCTVHMLVRGDSLEKSMSGYLIDKIAAKGNIVVHLQTELAEVDGGKALEKVVLSDRQTGQEETLDADQLFIMIGASPRTGWLPKDVLVDSKGFVITGGNLDRDARNEFEDTHERPPLGQETSMEGVFAAGDIVSGSQKRVASAVGGGADAVGQIHRRNEHLKK